MKKYLIQIKHNIDFIILDLVTLVLGYCASVEIRRLLRIPIWRGDLFIMVGIAIAVIYLFVAIFTQTYKGIMRRGLVKEIKAVIIQITVTWSIITVCLYVVKTAQDFSRSVYGSSALICTILIMFERVLWKNFVRNGRSRKKHLPKLLVVCDSDRAQDVVDRLLGGLFFNNYQLAGVVLNDNGANTYTDHFDSVMGVDKLDEFIADKDIVEAYVEISDSTIESKVTHTLLNKYIVVNKSLGTSNLNFQEQEIGELAGNSVITITTSDIAFSKRVEAFSARIWKSKSKNRGKNSTNQENSKEMKVCLVGSSGGHLMHLYMLKPFWQDKNRFWVTFDKEDAKSLLKDERMIPCFFPSNRSITALIKNTWLAFKVLKKERPDLIVSTGAAVAVPFFYVGKLYGAKCVYIEVFDRIDSATMTGKMVYPVADKFIVQWEELKKIYPKAVNLGSIF